MRRWIPILAIVLGLQVALAIALGVRSDRLAPTHSDTALVAADLKTVDRVVLDGPAQAEAPADKASAPATTRVEIVKREGHWVLPGYHDAPADAARLQALLDRLTHTPRGFPVAKSADARERFKVADKDYERRLVASVGDKPAAVVYVGASQGLRKSTARTAQDDVVYALDLPIQDLATTPGEWLDAGLLKVDAAGLSEIVVAARDKPSLTLARAVNKDKPQEAAAWQGTGLPADKRVDPKLATALTDAMAGLKVNAVLGTAARPEWQTPELTLSFKGTQGAASTWTIYKQPPQEPGKDPAKEIETYVLKASDRPWYLELKGWNGRPLLDVATPDQLVVAAAPAPAAASAPAQAPAKAPAKGK
jgi:hypothetical protein